MPGFIGGSSAGGSGVGGEISFPKEFIDPVTKLRVSEPTNLIDTDFEYGLQPTKWETVELINNTPSFFSKSGDTTIPDIVSITTNSGTREIIVTTESEHNLAVGIPINVTGTKSITADGAYIINSIPNTTTFTYLCKDIQPTTASIEDLYTSIITGEFFQGSQIRIADSEGITTDAAAVSTLTVRTPSPHGFGVNTPFYLLNLNSTVSQEFAAANTETKSFDASNSATAQTFDGSNTLSTINIDWSNSAVSGGVTSSVFQANATTDTITVNHGTENFVGKPIGTPLYYNVVAAAGYFNTNPRGVVFLKTVDNLGTSSSTFQVSESPDGNAIDIVSTMTGTFQLANQARTFAGNNINLLTQQEVPVVYDAPKTFDAVNTDGTVITQTAYSGGGLVTGTASEGATDVPFYQGTMVRYNSSTNSPATGLTNNATYFVDTTFQQGTSNSYSFTLRTLPAPFGVAIGSISGGGGVQTFKKIGISPDRDVIHIRDHGYSVKDMLKYEYPVDGKFTVGSIQENKEFYFVAQVYDAHNFQLSQSAGDLTPSTLSITQDRGTTVTTSVTPVGLTAPITYTVTSGLLPSGLTLNSSTGVVSGTVVEVIASPGRELVITATDADGTQAAQTQTYIINATAASISPATIDRTGINAGTAITPTTATTTNLVAPITWTVSSGTLPTGLTLNPSTGVVSGTPTETIASPGRQVTIKATDVGNLEAFQVHTYQISPPPVVAGQAQFTTPGTYNWTVPYTTTYAAVCVGGGGGGGAPGDGSGGGGGGGLGWVNGISLTKDQQVTVVVGAGGGTNGSGGQSYFINTSTVFANGGSGGSGSSSGSGGSGGGFGGTGGSSRGGGNGGRGGNGSSSDSNDNSTTEGGGGGGAGGYSGNGGQGKDSLTGPVGAGSGGAGGGGGSSDGGGYGGGGVGLLGQGTNGPGGSSYVSSQTNGGSGGASGTALGLATGGDGAAGGAYGGGGGGADSGGSGGAGGSGAVRIIWPSTNAPGFASNQWRSFPSTNTGNV